MKTSYNEAARYAAKQIAPEAFLRHLLPSVFVHWHWIGWDDSQTVSFPGDPDRRCDTVARFERIDGSWPPVALVLEFETEPSADMAPREGEYRLRLRREAPFQSKPHVPYDVVGGHRLPHRASPAGDVDDDSRRLRGVGHDDRGTGAVLPRAVGVIAL